MLDVVSPEVKHAPRPVQSTRIGWVDSARGIGIVAVVIGHSVLQGGDAALWIFAFHMPLFFLLSGFTSTFGGGPWVFFRKKVLSLLLPYLTTLLIFFLYWLLFYRFYSGDLNSIKIIGFLIVKGALYGSGEVVPQFPAVVPIGPLWFVLALFTANLVSFAILAIFKESVIAISASVSTVVMIGLVVGPRFFMPFSVDIALVAQVFVFAGIALRKTRVMTLPRSWPLVVLAAAALVISRYCGAMDMNGRQYHDFFISATGAIGGSILVLYFAIALEGLPKIASVFMYLGRASLLILCFHTADTSFFHFNSISPKVYQWMADNPLWWSASRLFLSLGAFEIFRRVPPLRYIYSLPGPTKYEVKQPIHA